MLAYPPARLLQKVRQSCFMLGALLVSGQAAQSEPQTLQFPYENVSDLRGVLNVFHLFRQACLNQPVTRDLPEMLVPEGYRILTREDHLWGTARGATEGKTAILSKTGSEQGDWDGGHAFVDFLMPTDQDPDGQCTVYWKRAWDYEQGRARLALGLFGVFDAQVSYRLAAVLASPPDDSLIWKRPSYVGVSDWFTRCWDGKLCNFKVLYNIDPKTGIDMSISRGSVRP
ncbi:hypothetical protein WNZ14_03110 [Hoeflea sp. AS60]|uniref:hypothetical protein n=1 Tax=Hoeflea sp. AS60 TaxID=3135780 RepID=UPI00317CA3BF